MHLLVGFPSPWPAAFRKSVAEFFLHFPFEISIKNVRFGRSLAQLILGALSLYPFEVKEGPERRFLSDVPFGRFRLRGPKLGFILVAWEILSGRPRIGPLGWTRFLG